MVIITIFVVEINSEIQPAQVRELMNLLGQFG